MRVGRYEPVQIMRDRPYARALRHIANGNRKAAINDVAAATGLCARDVARMDMMSDLDLAIAAMSHHFRLANPAKDMTPDKFLSHVSEIATVISLYHFLMMGQHIVQVDTSLTTEFRHTDLAGITVSDICLPWSAFYLCFDGPDAPYTAEFPLNGLMIHRDGERIVITPYFDCAFKWTSASKRQVTTLELSTSDDMDLSDALISLAKKVDLAMQHLPLTELPVEFADFAAPIRDGIESREPLVARILNLVGNALLYLIDRPDSGRMMWEAATPSDAVQTILGGKVGSGKVRQALIREGYVMVNFFALPSSEPTLVGDGSVRAHWRRGHWKRQPYGPRAALRKLIRIRPMLVGGSHGEANESGRVHTLRAKRAFASGPAAMSR